MRQKTQSKGKKAKQPAIAPLKKDKLFKRKLILLSIILILFIILILDKEFGIFAKIFGDRTIQFRRLW